LSNINELLVSGALVYKEVNPELILCESKKHLTTEQKRLLLQARENRIKLAANLTNMANQAIEKALNIENKT
jgi:hypothetical protein